LNKAIETVLASPLPNAPRKVKFSVIRVPFFLEPNYDETKPFIESNRERLVQKWGGVQGWNHQKHRHDLKGRGRDAGIPHFNLDRLASNSMASHRLIQHVGKTYGLRVSEGLYDRLNVYYFVDGHALNDRPRLAKVAAEEIKRLVEEHPNQSTGTAPMSEGEILKFLNGKQGRREIMEALHALDQLGVHGIPKFIIEGRTMVDGAAKSDAFVRIFREIEKRGVLLHGPIFKDILGIDDDVIQRGSHDATILGNIAA